MWKEVVAVKRIFKEMSSTTKMDLGKLRCEISGTTREIVGASASLRNSNKIDVSFYDWEMENFADFFF